MPRCMAIGCNKNGNHSFPKDKRLRKLWENATKIRNFQASSNSRLCGDHYLDSDYDEVICSATGLPKERRRLKKTAIPSVFNWNKAKASSAAASREHRYLQRSLRKELFPSISQVKLMEDITQALPEGDSNVTQVPEVEREIEVDSNLEHVQNSQSANVPISTATQTPHIFRLFSSEDMLCDSKSVLYYTGLENIDKFKLVFSTLLPMAYHLNYRGSQILNVSIEDQFLLMLIKLRRNKEDYELSRLFGVSKTVVGNIFITWVNFVYELWSQIDIWPNRHLVDYYMPELFKLHHSNTRVIIDGTEIPISKPTNPTSQQATFSSYKHHNTVKFLVGATPGGLISFCSEGYAGSTSDRQITERSALLSLCDEKDAIMADRGFIVQDLFENKNITINTPSFLKGLSQLPGVKLKHDRILSKNRIHIERIIGLTKTFKIIKTDVNQFYVPLLSRIFFICAMQSNFKEGIVKNK